MPWYLRRLPDNKCRTCLKKAAVQLYNTFNAPLGMYCKPCGQKALRERLKEEEIRAQRRK